MCGNNNNNNKVKEAKAVSSSIPKCRQILRGIVLDLGTEDPCHVLNLGRAGGRAELYLLGDIVDSPCCEGHLLAFRIGTKNYKKQDIQ